MIEVSHLSRFYGNHRAVDDVSFTIASNTIVGFLGLNGAGKTTTLKVIAGLLPPSAGTVSVDGEDLASAPESFRQRIGFLPESPPLYTEQTGVTIRREREPASRLYCGGGEGRHKEGHGEEEERQRPSSG